jgi:hypothetical protein
MSFYIKNPSREGDFDCIKHTLVIGLGLRLEEAENLRLFFRNAAAQQHDPIS